MMDGLFNHWLTAYRLTLQSDEGQEESDDNRARDLILSVTNSCGARIVRCLSDGKWHSVIRFVRIAHRIQDSDITALFADDLSDEPSDEPSDEEIDYTKIDLLVGGLEHLTNELHICEFRYQEVEQDPALAFARSNVLTDVLGFNAGFLHNEFRIHSDILREIDLNELEQWTAPGEKTPQSVDQRKYRLIRLRDRPAEND